MCSIESSVSEAGWKRRAKLEISKTTRLLTISALWPRRWEDTEAGFAAPSLRSHKWRSRPHLSGLEGAHPNFCHKFWFPRVAADGKVWIQLLLFFSFFGLVGWGGGGSSIDPNL